MSYLYFRKSKIVLFEAQKRDCPRTKQSFENMQFNKYHTRQFCIGDLLIWFLSELNFFMFQITAKTSVLYPQSLKIVLNLQSIFLQVFKNVIAWFWNYIPRIRLTLVFFGKYMCKELFLCKVRNKLIIFKLAPSNYIV